ncbi:MAG: hypothetical protein MUC41_02630 [Syntrophobacteraceae bacterium]|jgi:tetratricopeptide (TPR) repeat protein|nr:hypothetical protein [Syntrophobacteraceae bacterium]
MQIEAFFQSLLNLCPPWKVETVIVDAGLGPVNVHVAWEPSSPVRCPQCDRIGSLRGFSAARVWKHLDACGRETLVSAGLPVVDCRDHGCREVPPPWAAPGSEMTLELERRVAVMAEEMGDPRKVARLLGIDAVSVRRALRRTRGKDAGRDFATGSGLGAPAPEVSSPAPRQLSLFDQGDMSFVNAGIAFLKNLEFDQSLDAFSRHRSVFPRGYDVTPLMTVARFLLDGLQVVPAEASRYAEHLFGLWKACEKRVAEGDLPRLHGQSELKEAFLGRIMGEVEEAGLQEAVYLPGGLPLARILLEAGQVDQAVSNLQAAIVAHPQDAILHTCLGDAWWHRGEVRVARRCYFEAGIVDSVGIEWGGVADADLSDLEADLLLEYGGDARIARAWLPSHARIEGLFERRVARLHNGLQELVKDYSSVENSVARSADPVARARLFLLGLVLCENSEDLRFVGRIDPIQIRRAMKLANADLFDDFLQRIVREGG